MLGIVGGTGIANLEDFTVTQEHKVSTPFGRPSAPLFQGKYGEQEVVFLARHGMQHNLLPSEVNYRANIWALKSVGVTQIIGFSAVGSLSPEIHPGDLVIPNQYFDWTRGTRQDSFFGEGLVAHISTAEPICGSLARAIVHAGQQAGEIIHVNKAYACVNGPRLGTKAESHFLRSSARCDVVGMTNVPEAFLAREAQICYCTIAIVTDYDCWMDNPDEHVTVATVIARYGTSLKKAQALLKAMLEKPLALKACSCRTSLQNAVLTPTQHLCEEKKQILSLLKE